MPRYPRPIHQTESHLINVTPTPSSFSTLALKTEYTDENIFSNKAHICGKFMRPAAKITPTAIRITRKKVRDQYGGGNNLALKKNGPGKRGTCCVCKAADAHIPTRLSNNEVVLAINNSVAMHVANNISLPAILKSLCRFLCGNIFYLYLLAGGTRPPTDQPPFRSLAHTEGSSSYTHHAYASYEYIWGNKKRLPNKYSTFPK